MPKKFLLDELILIHVIALFELLYTLFHLNKRFGLHRGVVSKIIDAGRQISLESEKAHRGFFVRSH